MYIIYIYKHSLTVLYQQNICWELLRLADRAAVTFDLLAKRLIILQNGKET